MGFPKSLTKDLVITTTDTVPGFEIHEILGVVRGASVKAKHIGQDYLAAFKSITGGTIRQYEELFEEARDSALQKLERNAKKVKADAVINLRFATSMIAMGMSEILAYGTAVRLSPKS